MFEADGEKSHSGRSPQGFGSQEWLKCSGQQPLYQAVKGLESWHAVDSLGSQLRNCV